MQRTWQWCWAGKFAVSTMFFATSCASATVAAQSGIPATAPTTVTPSQLPSANPQPAPARASGEMDVQWDGHLLQITANNASLNGLLRSIANRTGTRLSGAVPEDRIFGNYGPAPLTEIVSELLDGLAVNTLFVAHTGTKPAELTFTARSGGPSAPIPQPSDNATDAGDPPQQPSARFGGAAGQPVGQPVMVPRQPYGGENPAAATDTSGTNPASPNGVKTPQEIFDQLQRLRAAGANRR